MEFKFEKAPKILETVFTKENLQTYTNIFSFLLKFRWIKKPLDLLYKYEFFFLRMEFYFSYLAYLIRKRWFELNKIVIVNKLIIIK